MFTFATPGLLWLLLTIPLFGALWFLARWSRHRKLRRFGRPAEVKLLMPGVSGTRPMLKVILILLSLAFIIVALARPWGGVKDEKTVKEGIEVVIAVDASNSMRASATDSPDGPDRMRTAKLILEKLINRLDNDRVGLIVYAGQAYSLIPVTNDYVSAKMFLNSIDPAQIAEQGTNISSAIEMATASFSESKEVGKAIVLITDAEELEDPESVTAAARQAVKEGIQIDVVGVGSKGKVTIPDGAGYMVDDQTGLPVETSLNEDLARKLAKEGKGVYVNASSRDALNDLDAQLSTLKKAAMESSSFTRHDELYAFFGWLAFGCLLISMIISESRSKWQDRLSLFKRKEVMK